MYTTSICRSSANEDVLGKAKGLAIHNGLPALLFESKFYVILNAAKRSEESIPSWSNKEISAPKRLSSGLP
jgi:hypothetical protein